MMILLMLILVDSEWCEPSSVGRSFCHQPQCKYFCQGGRTDKSVNIFAQTEIFLVKKIFLVIKIFLHKQKKGRKMFRPPGNLPLLRSQIVVISVSNVSYNFKISQLTKALLLYLCTICHFCHDQKGCKFLQDSAFDGPKLFSFEMRTY